MFKCLSLYPDIWFFWDSFFIRLDGVPIVNVHTFCYCTRPITTQPIAYKILQASCIVRKPWGFWAPSRGDLSRCFRINGDQRSQPFNLFGFIHVPKRSADASALPITLRSGMAEAISKTIASIEDGDDMEHHGASCLKREIRNGRDGVLEKRY